MKHLTPDEKIVLEATKHAAERGRRLHIPGIFAEYGQLKRSTSLGLAERIEDTLYYRKLLRVAELQGYVLLGGCLRVLSCNDIPKSEQASMLLDTLPIGRGLGRIGGYDNIKNPKMDVSADRLLCALVAEEPSTYIQLGDDKLRYTDLAQGIIDTNSFHHGCPAMGTTIDHKAGSITIFDLAWGEISERFVSKQLR